MSTTTRTAPSAPTSGPASDAALVRVRPLDAATGIILGLLLAAPPWAVILYFVLRGLTS